MPSSLAQAAAASRGASITSSNSNSKSKSNSGSTRNRKPCRFGTKCRNASCKFDHSSTASQRPISNTTNTSSGARHNGNNSNSNINSNSSSSSIRKGACKFGNKCKRPGCWFNHPTLTTTTTMTTSRTSSLEIATTKPVADNYSSSTCVENKMNEASSTATSATDSGPTTSFDYYDYQFCSQQECEERQELRQVSALEATIETCKLPQAQRILDPSLAVSKFRRSAAGTIHKPKRRIELERLLQQHLLRIAATFQATSKHPKIVTSADQNQKQNLVMLAEFLVDRLRMCQADATRLLGTDTPVSPRWHMQLVRILIWMRYWMPPSSSTPDATDDWMSRTIQTMVSTAMEQYWGTRESILVEEDANNIGLEVAKEEDDEMLCYQALSRMAQPPKNATGSHTSILLDYTRHAQPGQSYPSFRFALKLVSHILREEYCFVWKCRSSDLLPMLAKCCLTPTLVLWRYRTVQQYNAGFLKQEAVGDMDRLLGIPKESWSKDYATQRFGLPVESRDDDSFVVLCKSVTMADEPPPTPIVSLSEREDKWIFGTEFDPDELMGLSGERIYRLLEQGSIALASRS